MTLLLHSFVTKATSTLLACIQGGAMSINWLANLYIQLLTPSEATPKNQWLHKSCNALYCTEKSTLETHTDDWKSVRGAS